MTKDGQEGVGGRPTKGRRRLIGAALAVAMLGGSAAAAPASAGVRSATIRDLARARLEARATSGGARAAATATVARLAVAPADREARLRALAARRRPARVIVGLRSPADVAATARRLRRFGGGVRRIPGLAAVAVTARSPAELAAAFGPRSEVAYVEAAAPRRIFAEPAEAIDPVTGRPFDWALDGRTAGFVGVNAAPALAAVGGGSRYPVAVLDTGVDRTHPDLRANVTQVHDASGAGDAEPVDSVGHGTFVAGLIGAEPGNGVGLRGVAGRTAVLGVRIGDAETFDPESSAAGMVWAIDHGARVLNLSYGGSDLSDTERRALEYAYEQDVLPVAAAGNDAEYGNQVQFPAAEVGGDRGSTGFGLSVAATEPDGRAAIFSEHNDYVDVAAPGAGGRGEADCRHAGVYSTLPLNRALLWDDDQSGCSLVFGPSAADGGRYGYGEGTSFSTPLVAGVASVAWMANGALGSDQVADVVNRSARQTVGSGWNSHTGHGVVDAAAAVALARRYDTTPPRPSIAIDRRGRSRVRVGISGEDRTQPGHELAGRVDATLYTSTNGRDFRRADGPRRGSLTRLLGLSSRRALWVEALVCDGNVNCAVARRGPLRRGR